VFGELFVAQLADVRRSTATTTRMLMMMKFSGRHEFVERPAAVLAGSLCRPPALSGTASRARHSGSGGALPGRGADQGGGSPRCLAVVRRVRDGRRRQTDPRLVGGAVFH